MKPIGMHNYFVYITTNKRKTTLYTGVTNNLPYRLWQHEEDSKAGLIDKKEAVKSHKPYIH